MTLRERIINELHKMYDKLDTFQETTFFQENADYMNECGEAMGAIDNLINSLEINDSGLVIDTTHIREAYSVCSNKAGPENNYIPLDGDIAEDILNNYNDYKDVDVSDPYKYNAWIETVRRKLDELNLEYRRDE